MAIAFDAVAIPANALYTATFSWTHTPVGTPRGAAVIVVQEKSTDQVSGVTYGGVAMTRVRYDARTATEAGCVYIYFLGASVPAGAQTVTVTLTDANDTNAVSLTVTSAAVDTAVDVSNGLDAGIIANPSLAISPTVEAVIFYGIFSGLAAPVTTVETGSTHVAGKDYGTDSAMWARKSVAAGGATTIGYTAASDDVCHSALAIKELVATTYYQTLAATAIGVGGLTKTSTFYRTLPATAIGIAVLTTAKMFSQTLTAVALGVATLTKVTTYVKLLQATATGVATLTKSTTFYLTLAATAVGQAVLTKTSTFYRTLAATATGVASVSKKMYVTLAATAVGQAVVTTTLTVARSLAATSTGVAVLTLVKIFGRNLAATAQGVATLATQFIAGGVGFYAGVKSHLDTIIHFKKTR